jgi:16S rRNA (cytosine967-C5)-methyltransferase
VAQLAALQASLLESALAAVRVGGVVGYATCSPHVAETDVVVDGAVRRGGVEQLDVRPLLPEVEDLGAGPALRLWPHVHGTDGMFLAVLRRTR